MNNDGPELMDLPTAAVFLGINAEVLRRWARVQRIPAAKLGREWRFSRRQLLAFVEAGGMEARQAQTLPPCEDAQ